MRLDPPTEPKPASKQSRAPKSSTDKFEVVDAEPIVTVVEEVVATKVEEIVDKPVKGGEPETEREPANEAVIAAVPDTEIPELYLQVYALSDGGMDDVVEIARRTGLGQSEVEMVLSLRDRGT